MSLVSGKAPAESRRRVGVRVSGTVQGVGFRPFVFRLAAALGLGGFVRNDAAGVAVEIEGDPRRVAEFLERIVREAPPLAAVESISTAELAVGDERRFRIAASGEGAGAAAPVPPDLATCDACLAELHDPADRRHRYPFVNCTDCGPRFSIVRGVPYDRAATTMAGFTMCPACRAEYQDPGNRRFHAEPNACPDCGPGVRLTDRDGEPLDLGGEVDPVAAGAQLLRGGAILAVKGIGGYHLGCRAGGEDVVTELRRRKHRETKPFAILVRDLDAARALVALTVAEELLLSGGERPIVIAPRRPDTAIAAAVAPGCGDLGVMLPHSPLHDLLIADTGEPLVMTSGNVASDPIVHRDDEALARLGPIADAFLSHDRPIEAAVEDSVVRAIDSDVRAAPLLIRRSRGYVPGTLPIAPVLRRPVLACGAELKSAFCLASGRRAWVGPQAGDLKGYEALRAFGAGIAHFERLCGVEPELFAHDLHPDYLSTRYATDRGGELVGVQHHHAHLAACLAEHAHPGAAVGAIFDGAGIGTDGTIWGGEILAGDAGGCVRAGALHAVPQPGGDAAVREPWRMACAWLAEALGESPPALPPTLVGAVDRDEWNRVAALARTGTAAPSTSSAGRLFDAVAAIAGLRARVGHEGQAAMELEAAARLDERGAYRIDLVEAADAAGERMLTIDPREAIREIAGDVAAGAGPAAVAARFHNGLAVATAAAIEAVASARGLDTAVLSGGVFQNRLLLERTSALLRGGGLRVLVPERLPPNDGGIAYGQAAVAAAAGRGG